jgi:DNA-binding transcriptional LysR family regulator
MGHAIQCMNGARSTESSAGHSLRCSSPGFAAAAAELRMSPSAVSHAVRGVEDRLATPLFARTTRSVSLTEAGERFLAGVEPALTDIGKLFEGLTAERGEVTGQLRIGATRAVIEMALPRILAELARQRPRLTVEVRTIQISEDIVAQGFDAGIRTRKRIEQDMVTTRLTGSFKVILVPSTDYIDGGRDFRCSMNTDRPELRITTSESDPSQKWSSHCNSGNEGD